MEENQSKALIVVEQPKKRRGHRRKIEIDWDVFEQLCRIQCTLEEMVGVLKCSSDTIERAVKSHYGKPFAETFKDLRADGRASLRRTQWSSALRGNTAMQIWLGKQHLDQKDRPEEGHDEREHTLRIVYGEKQGGNGEDKEAKLKATFGDRNPLARTAPKAEGDYRESGEA